MLEKGETDRWARGVATDLQVPCMSGFAASSKARQGLGLSGVLHKLMQHFIQSFHSFTSFHLITITTDSVVKDKISIAYIAMGIVCVLVDQFMNNA